jgi:hypothetical protein
VDHQRLEKELKKNLQDASKRAKNSFKETVKNFQQVTPDFLLNEFQQGGDLIVIVAPADDKDGKIWGWYLDQGTRVRYAILTPDWKSKTVPNSLKTGKGAGRVIKIDTSNPQPGITRRGWTDIVAQAEQIKLEQDVEKTLTNYPLFVQV